MGFFFLPVTRLCRETDIRLHSLTHNKKLFKTKSIKKLKKRKNIYNREK